jgi:hypothetical protein
MRQAIKNWLPLSVVLTLAIAAAYGVGHNILRQSANDPQIQLAEDWANQIEGGTDITRLNLGAVVDPVKSLAPFGIIYNQDGSIANSSVIAPTTMAQPVGVFATVDSAPTTEVRFSWQPASGSRFAAVIKKARINDKTYYVLAGRSLREVENRIDKLLALTFIGWLIGQVVLLASLNVHVAYRAAKRVGKK